MVCINSNFEKKSNKIYVKYFLFRYVTPDGTETVTETYECCAGFARSPGAYGCDQGMLKV